MAVKFTNNAKTTLASGINSSVTTATVTDGSVFPTLGSGEHFYCTFDDGTNNEIVKVTARSGNTLTIVRGVDNTTARAFSASDAAELRATSALLTDIQENIAAKSANQTVYSATTASSATSYDIGIDPGVEANASVFLNGVYQHHNTFSFSGSTLTFDTAPPNGMALEVLVDNLVNLQSSNLTVDTFTAADVSGNPQTDFILSDAPAAEDNLLVFIDGVFQDQDAYTISNQTLTITDGVTADFGVTVYVINPVNIGTPSDNTVTSSKLSGNITMPADLTVTGDVAFDSPTFVVDNANSRVGIGTASPSTLLDIVGDVKMSANLTVDTSTLVVDASNNRVGIGTASPSATLDVAGVIQTTGYLAVEGTSGNTGSAADRWIGGDGTAGTWFYNVPTGSNHYFAVNNSNKFIISSSGNIGIGTSSPAVLLDVSGATPTIRAVGTSASNPSLTLSSAGITAWSQTVSGSDSSLSFNKDGSEKMRIDSSGNVGIGSGSPTSYNSAAQNLVIKDTGNVGITIAAEGGGDSTLMFADGTGGTAGYRGRVAYNHGSDRMEFHTAAAERMRIDSSGNLLVGTAETPLTLLSDGYSGFGVSGSGDYIVSSRFNGASGYFKRENSNGSVLEFLRDGTGVGSITVTTSSTSYNTTSDYRLKENVDYEFNALDRVAQLKPARFNFIADADTTVDGFLAHEVQDIVPEAIQGEKDAVDSEGNPEYQGIDQSKLVPLLTKAIQEQQEQIETLKQEIREIREGG